VLKAVPTAGGVTSGAGNVLAGGLIGIGVDAGTGANLDLRPNPMTATLAPEESEQASEIIGTLMTLEEAYADLEKKTGDAQTDDE
ncbi:MAG: hypothetical protein AAGJ87_09290, partial [Pseudomonadota bacterium]